jgi:hypothetical protein
MTTSRPYRVLLRAGGSREEWLEARRGGIGGSDAAAVLGWGGRHTPLEVYADKVTGIVVTRPTAKTPRGVASSKTSSPASGPGARTGTSGARRRSCSRPAGRGCSRLSTGFATAPFSRKIDGLLEVKTRSAWVSNDWDDELPADVTAQSLHYAAVYGIHRVLRRVPRRRPGAPHVHGRRRPRPARRARRSRTAVVGVLRRRRGSCRPDRRRQREALSPAAPDT